MEKISDELFANFLDGDISPNDRMKVLQAMQDDKELMGRYITARRFNEMLADEEEPALPLERMAAKSEDNLCDILCERYILRSKFPKYGSQGILGDAKNEQRFLKQAETFDESEWIKKNKRFFSTDIEKQWLTTAGVALYNVGRIMEGYGLSVTRHFYSSLEDISRFIGLGESLIAIVNEEILEGGPIRKSAYPNHAVCILSIDDKKITLYNPSVLDESKDYPLKAFTKAWETSKNYLVAAGEPGKKVYKPCPINLEDVELDDSLNDLLEAIAENAHDVWAEERIEDGWKYGKKRNDDRKLHPDLRPYSELPEKEKDYDRKMATATLKLATRLGFKIVPPDSDNDYHCPDCGKRLSLEMSFCPSCGHQLQLTDFIKE